MLNESSENYLETILKLSQIQPVVRAVDIANTLSYSKASVSIALKNLKEKDLIEVSKEGYIQLSEIGNQIAEKIDEKHQVLHKWLLWLGVSDEVAEEDACRIEHVISEEAFEKLKMHITKQQKRQLKKQLSNNHFETL